MSETSYPYYDTGADLWEGYAEGALLDVRPEEITVPDTPASATDEEVRKVRDAQRLAVRVNDEYQNLVAREKARERRAREIAGEVVIPDLLDLGDFLDQDDEAPQWRIEGVWPRQGNVVLAAQYKAGKTTMVSNILRSLADGARFLGIFQVEPIDAGCVVLTDFEMPEIKLRDWYRRQDIQNRHLVKIRAMRGRAGAFDLLNPEIRAKWVKVLADAECRVWIIDCLGPILSALSRDEDNKGVGPILDAITTTAADAEIGEVLLVHHMGHVAERARGASRLRDWPDAEWRLLRKKDEDNPFGDAQPDAPRFFTAFGRDVDVKEGQLHYDDATKRLTYAHGSRKEAGAVQAMVAVLAYLRDNPGKSGRQIEDVATANGVSQSNCRDAVKVAVRQGFAVITKGERNANLHTITAAGFARLAELSAAPRDEDPDDDWGTDQP
jgi:hypothetical protein